MINEPGAHNIKYGGQIKYELNMAATFKTQRWRCGPYERQQANFEPSFLCDLDGKRY